MKKYLLLGIFFLTLFSTKAQTLHLYGGSNHDVYLGCLTCNKYDSDSIWNQYGNYGSKYNSDSIWNKYDSYGSQYSDTSPWNNYGNTPPVVVDKEGNFYGYLSTNRYKDKRANFKLALLLYSNYSDIREDVSAWYKEIFE